MTPDDMVRRLLYRDGLMLIIDKPAGLSVHRGPKGGASLEDYFDGLRFGLPKPPSLAHRLDKETSGCLVLGRHRKALANLGDLFRSGRVGKTYWALVEGGPEAEEGRIDLALGKRDDNRGWWMKVDPDGLPSSTTWRVMGRCVVGDDGKARPVGSPGCVSPGVASLVAGTLSVPSPLVGEGQGGGCAADSESANHPPPQPSPTRGEGAKTTCGAEGADRATGISGEDSPQNKPAKHFTWLALNPLTGRTHQLRVHCAAMGWPIFGDDIYGTAPRLGGGRLHLHAREVTVPLYKNRAPVAATAPVPAHMRERLTACGWNGVEPPPAPSPLSARPQAKPAAETDTKPDAKIDAKPGAKSRPG